jgi:hypothetical protein
MQETINVPPKETESLIDTSKEAEAEINKEN